MILIWNGLGILVAVIWVFSVLTGDWLARTLFGDEVSEGLSSLTRQWLAAVLTLGLALLLRVQREARPDPDSGQLGEIQSYHALFFVPVIVWPVIFFVIGIGLYYGTARVPTLVAVTPSAAAQIKKMASEKQLPKGWYIRIEAHWPKDTPSPQHKIQLVTGPIGEFDQAFASHGIKIVVLKRQVEMFRGAQLNFGKTDEEEEFLVNNPNFEEEKVEKWRQALEQESALNGRRR